MAVRIQDGSGNSLTSTANALDINVKSSSGSQTVSGTVSVSNFPATQPVSGTVAVSNLPATQPVSGSVSVSNLPVTQAVSATTLPLPSGAATAAKQPALGTAGTPSADVISVQGVAGGVAQPISGAVSVSNFPGTQAVSGTVSVGNFPATQPISAASLPLPSGASTAAKQPALGTAGTPATDVLTVQGAASMTALKVDGSGVTQPVSGTVGVNNFPATQPISGSVSVSNFPATQTVSGTVTANIGTSGSLALDASITGLEVAQGSSTSGQKGILELGAVTVAAPTYIPSQTSALSLNTAGGLRVDGSGVTQPVSGTVSVSNFPATQPVSGTVTANAGTGNFTVVQATGTNLHTVIDSGSVTATQATAANLNATVVGSGNFTVVQATGTNLHTVVDSGTITAVTAITNALPAGTNVLGSVKLTDGTTVPGVIAGTTALKTDLSSIAGTATVAAAAGIQKVGISGNAGASVDTAISAGTPPTNVIYTTHAPTSAAAGAYNSKFINASGAAVNVKASGGNLYGFSITNETAAVAYIEFFNTASAPTLGTTAVVFAVKLPASANVTISPGAIGLQSFSTGIGFAVTTTENGTTTASVTGMIFYQ